MKRLIQIYIFLFSINCTAQLITTVYSAQELISSNFLGSAYTVSNIQYNGYYSAIGKFNASQTTIGLNEGIVLSTGTVKDTAVGIYLAISGPHGPNNDPGAGLDNGVGGYSLLSNMAQESSYNAAVLEFDVIPSIDSIGFNYVFGSDEYPEFVYAGFNDVFAIFISGPGIIDTVNIAKLPNGTIVSIDTVNNVNGCTNCQYYVSNGNGSETPYNTLDIYIQYDGMTTVLTAKQNNLQIGATYHIIFAISDIGDSGYDSGIFIESCSDCIYDVGLLNKKLDEFKVYPNPSNGVLTIETNNVDGEIYIYDLTGRIVQELIINKNENTKTIDGLKSGNYLISLITELGVTSKKIIVN